MSSARPSRVFIVAGGTGGHLYPGVAVAQALRHLPEGQRPEVQFVVRRGDLGRDVLSREGFPSIEISGAGFPRRLGLKTLKFPLTFLSSLREASSVIQSEKPDLVLGMGGYLSFSVLWAAARAGVSTLIHEQNVVPGMANRLLGKMVDSVAVSFPESLKSFPSKKTWVSGLPVRAGIHPGSPEDARRAMGLSESLPTFLLFGGSLGAKRLNDVFLETWKGLLKKHYAFQVIHVTGSRDFETFQPLFTKEGIPGQVMAYCHDMPRAYAAADLVISRSGASTIAELLATRRPAVLIPYPHATNDHQWFNAQMLTRRGQAEATREAELTAERMIMRLGELLRLPESLRAWKTSAAAAPTTDKPAADVLAGYISGKLVKSNRS